MNFNISPHSSSLFTPEEFFCVQSKCQQSWSKQSKQSESLIHIHQSHHSPNLRKTLRAKYTELLIDTLQGETDEINKSGILDQVELCLCLLTFLCTKSFLWVVWWGTSIIILYWFELVSVESWSILATLLWELQSHLKLETEHFYCRLKGIFVSKLSPYLFTFTLTTSISLLVIFPAGLLVYTNYVGILHLTYYCRV